ncbi:MAG: PD-(D/E)XK nuclease family protein [Aggregatilineales bacterium]
MPLPAEFKFTQSNLQDYVECARRFELRYVQQLQYPAVEAEPIIDHEKHMQQGATFHHMVHQHDLGVPESVLSNLAHEEPLKTWWANYLNHKLDLPEQRHAETALTAPLAGFRLLAKYDLLAIAPGEKAIIVDWKTSTRKPDRLQLKNRLQTIMYPYLLVRAGAHLNGGTPIQPEQVEMIYWFADDSIQTERFPYSTEQYHEDEKHLSDLITEINNRTIFDLTSQEWRCKFCTYRSLCRRGTSAGNLDDLNALPEDVIGDDADADIDFDFDQIAEVEF